MYPKKNSYLGYTGNLYNSIKKQAKEQSRCSSRGDTKGQCQSAGNADTALHTHRDSGVQTRTLKPCGGRVEGADPAGNKQLHSVTTSPSGYVCPKEMGNVRSHKTCT